MFKQTFSCAKLWRSAAFIERTLTAVKRYRGAAFSERNIEVFWIRLRTVQSSVKEESNCKKEDSIASEWNPWSNRLNRLIAVFLKESFGASICKQLPSQGSEPFDWKACNNTKKHHYEVEPLGACSVFWRKQARDVCMQYALPYYGRYIWTKQVRLYILKTYSLSSKNTWHAEKWMRGRLNFSRNVLHLST